MKIAKEREIVEGRQKRGFFLPDFQWKNVMEVLSRVREEAEVGCTVGTWTKT
jgi:hypothetical protein